MNVFHSRQPARIHNLLISTLVILFGSTSLGIAETFSCQINQKVGYAKSIPDQIEIQTKRNSRVVIISDNVSLAITGSSTQGREDGLRPRFRRFIWELRPVPPEFLPTNVRQGGRRLIHFSATINHETHAIKVRANFVQGTATAVLGDRHEGNGICRLLS